MDNPELVAAAYARMPEYIKVLPRKQRNQALVRSNAFVYCLDVPLDSYGDCTEIIGETVLAECIENADDFLPQNLE